MPLPMTKWPWRKFVILDLVLWPSRKAVEQRTWNTHKTRKADTELRHKGTGWVCYNFMRELFFHVPSWKLALKEKVETYALWESIQSKNQNDLSLHSKQHTLFSSNKVQYILAWSLKNKYILNKMLLYLVISNFAHVRTIINFLCEVVFTGLIHVHKMHAGNYPKDLNHKLV